MYTNNSFTKEYRKKTLALEIHDCSMLFGKIALKLINRDKRFTQDKCQDDYGLSDRSDL